MSLNGYLVLWMLIFHSSILVTLTSTSESTTAINSSENASINAIHDSTANNMLKDLSPAKKSLLYLISEFALKTAEEPKHNVNDMNRNRKDMMEAIATETTIARFSHISDTFDDGSLIGAVKDVANAPNHQTYSDDDSNKTSSVDVIGKEKDISRQEIMKTGKRKPATRVVSKIKRDFSRVTGTFGVDSAVEKKNARYSHYQSVRKHGRRPLGDPAFHSNSDKRIGYVQKKKEYDGLKRQHTTGSYSDLQGHRKILGVNDEVTPLNAIATAHHPKRSETTDSPSVFFVETMRSKGLVGYKVKSSDEQKMIRKSSNHNPSNPSSGFELTPKSEVSMSTFSKVHDDCKISDSTDSSNQERRSKKIRASRSSFTKRDNYGAGTSIINNIMKPDENTINTRCCASGKRGTTSTGIPRVPNQHELVSTCDCLPTMYIPMRKRGDIKSKTVKHKSPTSTSTYQTRNTPNISSSHETELRFKKLATMEAGFKKLTNVSSQCSVTNSAAISLPYLVLNLLVDTLGISEMVGRLETSTDQSSKESNVRKSNFHASEVHPTAMQKSVFMQKDMPEISIHSIPDNRRKPTFQIEQSIFTTNQRQKGESSKTDFVGYESLKDNVADSSIIKSENDVSSNVLSSFIRKNHSQQKALSFQTPLANTISRSPDKISVNAPNFMIENRKLSSNIHKHAFHPTTSQKMQFRKVGINEGPQVTASMSSSTFVKKAVHPSVTASLTSSDNIHRYRGPVYRGQISSSQLINDEDSILTNNITASSMNSCPVSITNQASLGNAHSITDYVMRTRLTSSNEVRKNSYPSVMPSTNTVHESSDSSVLTSLKSLGDASKNSYSGTTPSHASSGNICRTPDLDLTRSLKSSNGVQRNAYNSKIGNRKRLNVIYDELYPSTTDHMIQSVNIHENKDLSTKVTVMSSADVNKVVNPFIRVTIELSRTGHLKQD